MITSIQASSTQALRGRTCGTPAPAPEQEPATPQDQVAEFGLIDTPQEAAQLPILEPSFQFAMVMGLGAVMDPKQSLAVYLSTKNVSGAVEFDQGTGLHAPDEKGYVGHGGGYVGKNWYEGNAIKLSDDGQGVTFQQRFGQTDTTLTFGPAEHGTSIKGKLGQVDADLNMQIVMDNTGLHINTNGTLGGQPYQLNTEVGENGWTSKGSLNGVAIDKTYTTTQTVDEDGTNHVRWQGSGTNAGMDQTIDLDMRVSQR